MAPLSPTYDRLEAGHPPSKQNPMFRFGWKKFSMGAAALLIFVWLFVPREKLPNSLPKWGTSGKSTSPYEWSTTTAGGPDSSGKKPSIPPNHQDEDLDRPKSHPHSFESDPDPTTTTYCTRSSSSKKPLVQYGLMLDAGSTGSRIHIYKFNNCGPIAALEYEVFMQTSPPGRGLSSFAGRPEEAARSLDMLMNEAVRVVPVSMHKCTPVAVRATAGLRLLPGKQAEDILQAVEKRFKTAYPFSVPKKDAVTVMSGEDEAVFAWVTTNYLMGTLSGPSGSSAGTAAVLDLGGASTQIVFSPSSSVPLTEGEHKYELEFGGSKRTLYQHSYLGYGLMRARASVHRVVDFMADFTPGKKTSLASDQTPLVANPCLAQGTERRIELASRNVTMTGGKVGSFSGCSRIVELVLEKDAPCGVTPCSFGGVYQPTLGEAFPASQGSVFLLSYFYDRYAPLADAPLGDADAPLQTTVGVFAELAKSVCMGHGEWMRRWGTKPAVIKELEMRPEWCLDLTWMHALLHVGYEFTTDRAVLLDKKIAGTELGWALGAGFKLVGAADLQCRV